MAIIKVGFSKSRKSLPIVSLLIRLIERTKFSHAYVKFPVKRWELDLIYQATGSGVGFSGPKAFEHDHEVVEEYEIEVSDEAKDRILKWCAERAGQKYSKKEICGFLIKRLANVFGIKMANPFKDEGYVCTELASEIMTLCGYEAPENLNDMGLVETREMVLRIVKK